MTPSERRGGKILKSLINCAVSIVGATAALTIGAPSASDAGATTSVTLYVSAAGVDGTNTCAASGSPCATISHALTQVAGGNSVVINLSGTIDDNVVVLNTIPSVTITGALAPKASPAVLNGVNAGAHGVGIAVGKPTALTVSNLTVENYGSEGIDSFQSSVSVSYSSIINDGLGINNRFGVLTVDSSTLSGNVSVGGGGAIASSSGTLMVTNSTISGNSADLGGGIYAREVVGAGSTTVIDTTIAGNTAITAGGGIYINDPSESLSIGASIVSGNKIVGSNKLDNCGGFLAHSLGYNLTNDTTSTACNFVSPTDLVNTNPHLGVLEANGGPTKTMLPGLLSPAANVIPIGKILAGLLVCGPGAIDQRGIARPQAGTRQCTIGSVEVDATLTPTTTAISVRPSTAAVNSRVVYIASVSANFGTAIPTGTVTFKIGKTRLCKASLIGGAGACASSAAPVGTDTVTGVYSGAARYATSSGTTLLKVS